jgi:pimeloyl-ACP methyl ester carboxylesterase
MLLATFLCMINFFSPNLQTFSLTVDGLACYAYSYSDMSSQKPLLLLVHGSPGDYSDWNKYLKDNDLQEKYRILAIDRPGYGQSVKEGTLAFPTIAFQAKVVRAFAQQYVHQQPLVLVGHSVGGPIVTHYAMNFSDEIKALILLAPAISAKHEQPRWYNRMAAKAWVNKRVGQKMRISQAEMMALPAQLEAMESHLQQVKCETWLFHGRPDLIAPYGNALYVEKNFINSTLHFKTYPFNNHFIHHSKWKDVKRVLLNQVFK